VGGGLGLTRPGPHSPHGAMGLLSLEVLKSSDLAWAGPHNLHRAIVPCGFEVPGGPELA
jgi:hypothetical protein